MNNYFHPPVRVSLSLPVLFLLSKYGKKNDALPSNSMLLDQSKRYQITRVLHDRLSVWMKAKAVQRLPFDREIDFLMVLDVRNQSFRRTLCKYLAAFRKKRLVIE